MGDSMTADIAAGALLTDRFRENNRAVHRKSDALVNLKLAAAMTDERMYIHALLFFRALFAAIENALQKNAHLPTVRPMFEAVCAAQASRTERFDRDITFFEERLGASPGSKRPQSAYILPESVLSYVKHISKLAESPETAFLVNAYAYTMMQAILGGGRILKALITKGLALDPESENGVSIFCLGQGLTAADVRAALRKAINVDIGPLLNEEQTRALIMETNQVFLRNNRMVSDLRGTRGVILRVLKWFLLALVVVLLLYKCASIARSLSGSSTVL